ncbi:MAG: cytochrome c [Pseudomonadota bacterium]
MRSLLLIAALLPAVAPAGASGEDQSAALERLVLQDCGACHGLTLAGGLGPDIRPDALAGTAADALATIILDGLPGTAMPPWRPLISEEDAQWIARYLLAATAR